MTSLVETNWFLAILFFLIALAIGYLYSRSKQDKHDDTPDTGEPPP